MGNYGFGFAERLCRMGRAAYTGPIDGSVVPCAAAGSLPFLPDASMRVLRRLKIVTQTPGAATDSWTPLIP